VAATNVNSTAITYTIPSAYTGTATLDKFTRVQLVDSADEPGANNYTAVTTTQIDTKYANGAGEDTYNVPGNLNYVADSNVDFIIKSNED